jgi:hypothetical protein
MIYMSSEHGCWTVSLGRRVAAEIRNPKAEIRGKAEIRIPKGPSSIPATWAVQAVRLADLSASDCSAVTAAIGLLASVLGFRISFGFRVSDFGFGSRSARDASRYHKRFLLSLFLCITVAAASAFSQTSDDKQATFFMGRVKYSSSDGNDCGGVGQELMQLVSRASTIKVQEERKVRLTDPDLFETPFLFMNGHNDFVLTEPELASLRKYLSHGGFFFASGCCTSPGFPKAWRREFSRIFPNEQVKPIPYDHLIYRSFYKIDRIRCLHEQRDIQLEGIFYEGNLVAVMCEDGLCCAFSANNTCNSGKGVSPEDGQKLTLNIAVYALTH